jgi:hypothetical protein
LRPRRQAGGGNPALDRRVAPLLAMTGFWPPPAPRPQPSEPPAA